MFESIFGRMLCIPCRQVYVLPSYFFSFLFVCPHTKTLLQTSSCVSLCLLIYMFVHVFNFSSLSHFSIYLFVYVFYFTSLSSLSFCLCMYFTLPLSLLYLSVCISAIVIKKNIVKMSFAI